MVDTLTLLCITSRVIFSPQDSSKFLEEEVRCNWILNYAAMIENLDTGLGMLLEKLKKLNIEKNTYVIFFSDNGGGFRENLPLKGGKADLTEGGLRVPMVVQGPDIPGGTYCDKPVTGWDFFPTFAELTGNKTRLSDKLDGGSLVDLFRKGNKGRVKRNQEALIFHFPWYNGEPESAIRLGDYKLLKNLDTKKMWLYDLKKDIEEKKDLKKTMPEKARDLDRRLTAYLKSVGAEHVQTLRLNWRKRIVEIIIPEQEKKIKKLRKEKKKKELAKVEHYLKWLKEQVIFIDKRSRMHEK